MKHVLFTAQYCELIQTLWMLKCSAMSEQSCREDAIQNSNSPWIHQYATTQANHSGLITNKQWGPTLTRKQHMWPFEARILRQLEHAWVSTEVTQAVNSDLKPQDENLYTHSRVDVYRCREVLETDSPRLLPLPEPLCSRTRPLPPPPSHTTSASHKKLLFLIFLDFWQKNEPEGPGVKEMLSNQRSLPFLCARLASRWRTVAGLKKGGVIHERCTHEHTNIKTNTQTQRAIRGHTHPHVPGNSPAPPSSFSPKIVLIFRQWWSLWGSGSLETTGLVTVTSDSAADGGWGHTVNETLRESLFSPFRSPLWLVLKGQCHFLFEVSSIIRFRQSLGTILCEQQVLHSVLVSGASWHPGY